MCSNNGFFFVVVVEQKSLIIYYIAIGTLNVKFVASNESKFGEVHIVL
jgi:hypothetical protein